MIDTPQITQTPAQLTAFIHLTVPRAEIRNVAGAWPELNAWIAANGHTPAANL